MNLKIGDTFRYLNETFDMIIKLESSVTEFGPIYGRILSYKRKGWINEKRSVSFSYDGIMKYARKINIDPEPILIYKNKNQEEITNTLRKTK